MSPDIKCLPILADTLDEEADMGILQKDPEKEAAKERERQRKAEEAAKARQEEDRRRAEAAFWASPQGQARAARHQNRRFYQVSLPLSATERSFAAYISGDKATKTSTIDPTDLLAIIESEGWTLENVGYVFRETGSVSRDKMLSSGQTASVTGEIVGIYLFRASEPADTVPPIPG
jgi:hypothetical protein